MRPSPVCVTTWPREARLAAIALTAAGLLCALGTVVAPVIGLPPLRPSALRPSRVAVDVEPKRRPGAGAQPARPRPPRHAADPAHARTHVARGAVPKGAQARTGTPATPVEPPSGLRSTPQRAHSSQPASAPPSAAARAPSPPHPVEPAPSVPAEQRQSAPASPPPPPVPAPPVPVVDVPTVTAPSAPELPVPPVPPIRTPVGSIP